MSVDNADRLGLHPTREPHTVRRHQQTASRSEQRTPLPTDVRSAAVSRQFWFARYHSLDELKTHERNNARLLFRLATAKGLSDTQIGCAEDLISTESHFDEHDYNPSSGAYGAPQALPGEKMAAAGPDWHDNVTTQFKWLLDIYLPSASHGYHGDPCEAEAHSLAYGWY